MPVLLRRAMTASTAAGRDPMLLSLQGTRVFDVNAAIFGFISAVGTITQKHHHDGLSTSAA
jgi:hypothetical protein